VEFHRKDCSQIVQFVQHFSYHKWFLGSYEKRNFETYEVDIGKRNYLKKILTNHPNCMLFKKIHLLMCNIDLPRGIAISAFLCQPIKKRGGGPKVKKKSK
jgi:hypothetical protein